MMKKSIFSKLMACLIVLASAFVVSACSVFQKEDTNIKSIVIDQDSIPDVIVVGEFDNAGIEAIVTYDDDSTETITITTAMIPEQYRDLLNEPGIYKISIMFRNATTELEVRMVNSTNIYQVNFYNNKNQLITTQFVYDGEDATLPSEVVSRVENYALAGWDRSHENISEDTNIYGLYVNIENTLSDAKMQQVLLNAEQYYMTTSHFTSVEAVETYDEETTHIRINYHYDSEKQLATSQSVSTSDDIKTITIFGENDCEMLCLSSVDGNYYSLINYEDIEAEWDEAEAGMSFDQMLASYKLTGGYEGAGSIIKLLNYDEVEFGYEITSNKLIYTFTASLTYVYHDTQYEITSYTIKYDDEKVLQIIYSYNMIVENLPEACYSYTCTYNIDYVEIPFEENLIPNFGDVNGDGDINTTDGAEIQRYLAGEFELTEDQLLLADVDLDGQINEYDYQLIQMYVVNKIPYIPFTKECVVELFDNAMAKSLDSGIVITQIGKWNDDDGEATTTTTEIDFINKVAKTTYSGLGYAYIWESEGVLYEAFVAGDESDCYKTTGATFEYTMNAENIYMFIGYEMIYGGTYNDTTYEFVGIEIVDGNFVITINASRLEGAVSGTIKYTFNKDWIVSVESTYDYTGTYTYTYIDATIRVPEDIKALESSAIEDND